jgi:SAM-dependent methyltransferase
MADWTDRNVQRRVISYSGFRLDGLGDLLPRARGASVFDVGCNRGHVCFDLMHHGATVLHGCDISPDTIRHANELFADYPHVEAKFEVVDLTGGAGAIKKAFGDRYRTEYDMVLFLAVYHKLKRVMPMQNLLHLIEHLAHHTGKYFVYRGAKEYIDEFAPTLEKQGFYKIAYSEICLVQLPQFNEPVVQPSAIWSKQKPAKWTVD